MNKKLAESTKNYVEKVKVYGVLAIILFLLLSFFRGVYKIFELGKAKDEVQARIEKLNEENKDLQSQLDITKSDEFVEHQLRDKLGLAKPGETIVVLPDTETLKKISTPPEKEENTLPEPNWKKWAHLFGL